MLGFIFAHQMTRLAPHRAQPDVCFIGSHHVWSAERYACAAFPLGMVGFAAGVWLVALYVMWRAQRNEQ